MNMCLLKVAMCEKCRSSHCHSEGTLVKNFRTAGGLKNFRTAGCLLIWEGGGGNLAGGGSVPH